MISPEEARKRILDSVSVSSRSEKVRLSDAYGRVASRHILAPVSLPPFDNSAVDGYAVCLNDRTVTEWQLAGEIQAGDAISQAVAEGNAFRIFTGAPVPDGANTVIMQEHIEAEGSVIRASVPPVAGTNIRKKGSQIEQGAVAIPLGTVISAASIGFLASLGIMHVEVSCTPSVGIIVTGNELTLPGTPLEEGKIYESNSFMLEAALKACGINDIKAYRSEDDKGLLLEVIQDALASCNIVLLTGGISVGKYDLVKQCLEETGVKEIFYKIAQKPGKPMYFGLWKQTPVFALPGNPASVLTCFYEYVYPALRKLAGSRDLFLPEITVPLVSEIKKKAGLVNFLKGKLSTKGVEALTGQESYILKSFSEADCLICLEADVTTKANGELVQVHLVPFI